jgi:hypothetical protein
LNPVAGNVPILGKAASTWLKPGRSGKVLAAVKQATYLRMESGELIWLASAESPMHRRCIRWPVPLPDLEVGTSFMVQDRSINLSRGIKLDLSNSKPWENPVIPIIKGIEFEKSVDKLHGIIETLLLHESPSGFGAFIRPILQIARKQLINPDFLEKDMLTRDTWVAVEKIARACLCHDFMAILKEAEPLTGLGEGLTPAGDDFLGGLFFAINMLSCSCPTIHYYEPGKLPEWVERQRPRTNEISFTLLKDNATGHALEPINRLGIALLKNRTVESVHCAALDLIKIGHSTGWSLLAGFLTGLLPVT